MPNQINPNHHTANGNPNRQNMIYRLAAANDVECLSELFWEHANEFDQLSPADKETFVRECSDSIKERLNIDLYCWVVENNGRIISHTNVIIAHKIPRPGKIIRKWGRLSTVRTVPEYRNQGVGSALMEVVKNWCKKQNLEELHVGPSERSVPFYERAGFKNETDIMEILFE
jgi:GNAT superfamily N-acetyltransferase